MQNADEADCGKAGSLGSLYFQTAVEQQLPEWLPRPLQLPGLPRLLQQPWAAAESADAKSLVLAPAEKAAALT